MIRHTVVFSLHHAPGSAEESSFFEAAFALATIEGVEKFEQLRQVSPKSDFAFGLSMEFASEVEYEHYNTHPDHVAFVAERWMPEVASFQELDFTAL